MKYYVKMSGMLGPDEYMIMIEDGYGYDGVTNKDSTRVAKFDTLDDAIEYCEMTDEYIVSTEDEYDVLYEGNMITEMDHFEESSDEQTK